MAIVRYRWMEDKDTASVKSHDLDIRTRKDRSIHFTEKCNPQREQIRSAVMLPFLSLDLPSEYLKKQQKKLML